MNFYSLLVTSCDRDDLLEKTITTYLRNAEVAPREIIIVDNGPKRPMPAFLNRLKHLGVRWINEGMNRGQIYSCDRLWQECKYEYAMWMEEDWVFVCGDFIKKSFEILEKYPEVLTVTLRGDWGHPLISDSRFPFKIAEPAWKGVWGGFTFNPGLRRKSDYKRIGTYGKHVGYGTAGLGHEMELSKLYASMGYVLAAIPDRCSHTGGGRSISVAPIGLVDPPKVLIAVPACHKFEYGPWESSESPHFDRSKAWKGQPYGTDIHISGANPRIGAVRETWFKDIANHKNMTGKFFYGRRDDTTRQPAADEVFLHVEDDYAHLPQKTVAICQWALDHQFEYLFKCDDDTFVYVDKLAIEVQSEPFDYAGYLNGNSCSGGCGYWLSKRAMEEVVRNPIHSHWAEDVTVGIIMKQANIPPVNMLGHRPGFTDHWFMPEGFDPGKLDSGIVTAHAVQPEIMRQWYESL